MNLTNTNKIIQSNTKGDFYMFKKLLPLLLITAITCFVTPRANAGLFSVLGGHGSSTVGTGGDYASLYDASTDYDNFPGGQTGDWTLVIANSLTEYSTIAFGNISNGYTFTMKPATSGVVVTLNNQGNASIGPGLNGGTPGNLLFGVNNYADSNENVDNIDIMTSMNNVVLDGSHNGTNSQDLTITCLNVPAVTAYAVAIYGSFTNFTVKNMVINYSNPTKFDDAMVVESIYGNNNQGAYPSGGVFLNDTFSAGTNGLAFLVSDFFVTNPFPAGATAGNMVLNGCTFQGDEGVEFNFIGNCTLTNSTIIVTAAGNENALLFGVEHINANSSSGWTANITNNVFAELTSAAITSVSDGIRGIFCNASSGTYNISNNVITGFNINGSAGAVAGRIVVQGINCQQAISNYNVINNSIYIASQFGAGTTESGDTCFGIGVSTTANYTGTANVENNIVEVFQAGGACIEQLHANTGSGTIHSNYNDLYAGANANVGRYAGANEATLANWQSAASQDAGSQNVDVTATSPASWATPQTSLQFTPSNMLAGALYGVNQAGGVTTDITGATRNSPTWPGAYDNGSISLPVELSRFEIKQ